MIEQIVQYGTFIILLANVAGLLFVVDKKYRDPDIKADKDITKMNAECELKHKRLDEINADTKENIKEIKESLKFLNDNHITHIERDLSTLTGDIKEVRGQLSFLNEYLIKLINKKYD